MPKYEPMTNDKDAHSRNQRSDLGQEPHQGPDVEDWLAIGDWLALGERWAFPLSRVSALSGGTVGIMMTSGI